MKLTDVGREVDKDTRLYHNYLLTLDVEEIQDALSNGEIDLKIQDIVDEFKDAITTIIKGKRN